MGTRLLIVEDHHVMAQTLEIALRAEGFDVDVAQDIGEDAVLDLVTRIRPTVVVLDLDLGEGRTAIPMVAPMRELGAVVLVLTGTPDRRLIAESIEAGAVAALSKSAPYERLLAAVHRAADGGAVEGSYDRDELLRDLRELRGAEEANARVFGALSPSEEDVLRALIEGLTAEAIAAERVVSLATVRTQIRSILTKLGVNSQLAAVALARQAGWS